MSPRIPLLAGLVLASLALPAFAQEADPEPPSRTTSYKTPQACFEASIKASQKKDFKTAVDCLAPSTHKDVAAQTALMMLGMKNLGEEFSKTFKPVFEVMEKHGLTEKATKDIKTTDPKAAMKTLAGLIKKPTPFLVELMAAQDKAAAGLNGGLGVIQNLKYKLADVKVKGDKATATLEMSFNGSDMKQPMEFVKFRGGWKMMPNLQAEALVVPAPAQKEEKLIERRR